ncbi:LysR family transcriptional regulator [Pseudomonas aeruginosa]|nr:LysR family transcriptional regulator [Pseudomonas aeruginosa]
MHLSPESLEAFVQAVSLGSFSAAARKLGKSQSTVSEAIARLEIDLGLELFDRSGRQPQLTEAGRTLLGRVEEVLGASDRLRRVAAQPHYPPELGVAAVAERAEFGLFAAVDHPLAGLERVSERDLSEWRLLRLNTYSETGAAINDGLPSSGGRCWSAPNYLLLLEMATHGFGWAELPRWLVSGYANGRLKELPVSGWPRSQAVDVVWSRQRPLGPAANWLLDRLLDRDLPI